MANQQFIPQPPPPKRIQVNGKDESPEMATRAAGSVDIGYDITDGMRQGGACTAIFYVSTDGFKTVRGPLGDGVWHSFPIFMPPDDRLHYTLTGLAQNTHYQVRAYTKRKGMGNPPADKFNAFDFWTNRKPDIPTIVSPADNTSFVLTSSVFFDWQFTDADPGDNQTRYELRWRNIMDNVNPGMWTTVSGGADTFRTQTGSVFRANRYYEWQVRVFDSAGLDSDWSLTRSFYVKGASSPPVLIAPISGTALDVTSPITFQWQFRDPDSGDTQAKADIRYRAVGTEDWILVAGAATTAQTYVMPANTLLAGVLYEWQAQTYDVGSGGAEASGWANGRQFFGIRPPGELAGADPIIGDTTIQGALGCGHHRVFIYWRGGTSVVGEITSIQQVMWKRQRDDISNCIIDTAGFDSDCGDLLSRLRSWQHEVVVFRDGVRVWEGPITRLTYTVDSVEIEAKDVMAYVYRRIMRQGYDDSYNCTTNTKDCIGGIQTGLNTVVYRASRIIIDALGRDDPNVLPYLTPLDNPNDARQSRVVPDYGKTAWEEVDDLAATAGLDYVTVGRRIMLWDTHYPVGRLPEMRDGDFTDPVIVTEYGMNLATYYGVTDGTGIWGDATPLGTVDLPDQPGEGQVSNTLYYGSIEILSSSYGDSENDANEGVPTPTAVAELRQKYATQAQRNISNRYPTPVVVRVPDNTSISPDVNLSINHLIPGVWIPLRSVATLREVSQWQKLDSVTVTEVEGVETVQVVMSPAPNGGQDDPDADGANEDN